MDKKEVSLFFKEKEGQALTLPKIEHAQIDFKVHQKSPLGYPDFRSLRKFSDNIER